MSRPLQSVSSDKPSATGLDRPVMVYMCECGTKWTNSQKALFECKCGRQLVKRNGIIHAAIVRTSWQIVGTHAASA
jgi:hypothetical protein